MRVGLVTSSVLHAAILTWGLWTLGEPESFEVDDVEALPVELVTLAEITQVQEGSETARLDGPSAPDPVENNNPVPLAENIGDNAIDQQTPETEEQLPVEVEEARLPDPVDAPLPAPEPRPEAEPVIQPEPEATPATPATEVAPVPEPRQEVTPEPPTPTETAAEAEPEPAEQFVELPDTLPTIAARPERPPAQTAQTPERENREQAQTTQAAPRNTETDTSNDDVAALINRDRGSGGGAAASNAQASRGAETTTGGSTLTQSEMDALRSQIQACWNPPAGISDAGNLRVSVRFSLDRSGRVEGQPRVTESSGNRQADESARRAVLICGQSGYRLPEEKYDAWRDVIVNFDPSDMFR